MSDPFSCRECEHCGRRFLISEWAERCGADQRYCRSSCRRAAWNRRHPEVARAATRRYRERQKAKTA